MIHPKVTKAANRSLLTLQHQRCHKRPLKIFHSSLSDFKYVANRILSHVPYQHDVNQTRPSCALASQAAIFPVKIELRLLLRQLQTWQNKGHCNRLHQLSYNLAVMQAAKWSMLPEEEILPNPLLSIDGSVMIAGDNLANMCTLTWLWPTLRATAPAACAKPAEHTWLWASPPINAARTNTICWWRFVLTSCTSIQMWDSHFPIGPSEGGIWWNYIR